MGLTGEVLITAGVILGLFVVWQLFYTDILSGRTQDAALESTDFAEDSHLPPVTVTDGEITAADVDVPIEILPDALKVYSPDGAPITAEPAAPETFGRLWVPRWGSGYVKPISQGTDRQVTLDKLGIGHYQSTAMPGEVGNFALAGHRTSYGKPFADIDVTEKYYEMVENASIRKTKINAREFFQTLAEIQFESGYPYIMFEDTVNRANPIEGKVTHSNLCSEILQVSTPSTFNEDLSYDHVGRDISCNLGSMNIALSMDSPDLGKTVETAIRALTAVSDQTDIESVPSVKRANRGGHAIGLGQMNLHGYLARERIFYGSDEGLDFTNIYFYTVAYHAIRASNLLAQERGSSFYGFEKSKYATGEYFTKYLEKEWAPRTERVARLFADAGVHIPTQDDWRELAELVRVHGLYNQNLQAVPPTGSISYINHSTSSIHPIASKIEIRKEGKIGRVYYPAPFMTNDNLEYYQDAYEIGYEKIIDTYAEATQHVDQGLSLTLFFKDTATTRDLNKAQIYAWRKGIKTIYYIRLRQLALEGTEVEGCVSCML